MEATSGTRTLPHGCAPSGASTPLAWARASSEVADVLLDTTVLIDALRGRTLSQADCLIAAAAHSLGATLATGNVKDHPMHEPPASALVVDLWPVGV
ncbi:MAG: hypothetical protein KGJ43_07840 [Acidobacteriota bacterium]|nr:hypothetical protein [Acidobacteriota bacterium]